MIEIDNECQTTDVNCDKCSYSEQYQLISWSDVISEMKSSGWRIKYAGNGDWVHICPNCNKN